MTSPAAVSGQQTTFNSPNFLGELHRISPASAPLYTMIGGRAAVTMSKDFEWSLSDNDSTGSQDDVALEGATPTGSGRARGDVNNVCQIVQEAYEISYTKMAATGNLNGLAILGDQVVRDEKTEQAMLKLDKIKNDLEWSFLHGVYAKPADNNTVRKTRGVLTAVTTNVVTASDTTITGISIEADDNIWTKSAHGLVVGDEIELLAKTGGTGLTVGNTYFVITVGSSSTFIVSSTLGGSAVDVTVDGSSVSIAKRNPLRKGHVDKLLRTMADNLALAQGEGVAPADADSLVVVCNSYNRQRLSSIYGYAPESRTVGGLRIDQLLTDFCTLGIVYDRHVKSDTLGFINVPKVRPRVLPIPGKGFLFEDKLAQVGSAEKYQIYGEIGCEYGWEGYHGKIVGLTTDEEV